MCGCIKQMNIYFNKHNTSTLHNYRIVEKPILAEDIALHSYLAIGMCTERYHWPRLSKYRDFISPPSTKFLTETLAFSESLHHFN